MAEQHRREVGLFRYALIRDAADLALSKAERGRLVRALSEREHVDPDGQLVRISAALVGRKVELVFDPFDLTRIEVRYQHRPFGLAVPLQIGRHTHPQAQRELPPPPASTGDRLPAAAG